MKENTTYIRYVYTDNYWSGQVSILCALKHIMGEKFEEYNFGMKSPIEYVGEHTYLVKSDVYIIPIKFITGSILDVAVYINTDNTPFTFHTLSQSELDNIPWKHPEKWEEADPQLWFTFYKNKN